MSSVISDSTQSDSTQSARSSESAIDVLYESIQRRPRPEDVAELVLDLMRSSLSAGERKLLEKAAHGSLRRLASAFFSSMSDDFARVQGADRMVATTSRIFDIPEPPSAAQCVHADVVLAYTRRVAATIQADLGQIDFRANRLNREERKAAGLEIRKRGYNRRFRAIRRLSARVETIARNQEKYLATRLAKSGGATLITREELGKDLNTACFVAYLSARMNLRSAFTNTSQVRAYDEVAAMLFERTRRGTPNWFAIALVHPEREVLARLFDEERGRLLGTWTELLGRLARLLETLHAENRFDLATMIVRRGNDSSSWNAAAGAWNQARTHWLSLVYALGMEAILDHYCPGKVMRLMAADVVAWHAHSKGAADGSALDPNTHVFRDLPLPWRVFAGEAACSRALVEKACDRRGVPRAGWVTPPTAKSAVAFTPTPELVHGVAVSSPFLAAQLRKAGWFSGKAPKAGASANVYARIVRDEFGAALLVADAIGGSINHESS